MKIAISITIEIDPEKWDPFATPAELRKDVKAYVLNLVQESTAMQDADGEVSIR